MSFLEVALEERRGRDPSPVGTHFHGTKRFFDPRENITVVKIFSGDWYVSPGGGEMLATILGSCVSACIRDPVLGIGGMNHFLLPGDEMSVSPAGDAARYGVF